MGQRITYVDDLDGTDLGPDAKPTSFSLGGKRYSLYLSDENLEKFYDVLKPYTQAADVAYDHGETRKASKSVDKARTKAARIWAQSTGYKYKGADGNERTLGDRGAVPSVVVQAWEEAGSPGLD